MTPSRAALERLAAPGGPLEIRRPVPGWTGAPQFAELAAQLTPVEWDVLTFLDSHKIEIAPDDFSAQDVPREAVLAYFGFATEHLDAVVEALENLALAELRGRSVGLSATAVQMLASRPATSAPPRS